MLWIWRLVCDAFDQFSREVDSAKRIHLIAQPLQDKEGIAAGEALIEVWEHGMEFVENLSGVEVPQRIGREIAKTAAPVNILQHAFRVVGGFNTQVFSIFSVPSYPGY